MKNKRTLIAIMAAFVTVATAWSAVADAQTTEPPTTSPPLNSGPQIIPTSSSALMPSAIESSPELTPSTSAPTASTQLPMDAQAVAAVDEFVKAALNTRQAVGVTPIARVALRALDTTTIDTKVAADTARLQTYFSGQALDQAKFGLDNGIKAEKGGTVRITDGGSRVLSISNAAVTGLDATVSGLQEEWLTTAVLLPTGWNETKAYAQSTFVATLKDAGSGWRIDSLVSTRTPAYGH